MNDTVYLYSYGNKRHIAANPGFTDPRAAVALCGGVYDTDAAMTARAFCGPDSGPQAERRIAKARSLPVCQRCQKAADQ